MCAYACVCIYIYMYMRTYMCICRPMHLTQRLQYIILIKIFVIMLDYVSCSRPTFLYFI